MSEDDRMWRPPAEREAEEAAAAAAAQAAARAARGPAYEPGGPVLIEVEEGEIRITPP